ncbi:MAG TPA: type II toxin-antitoxin system VapC family toxin [Chthoniobacteraceae bacterium]|jgi:hypothetical protein|nr:type II toxin-antitoxin system VapC family toxin [Chthoniobacteraceae bacterium]
MILADTSIWIRHFREGIPDFERAMQRRQIAMHPVVIGELATGNLPKRQQTLAMLRKLRKTKMGSMAECLDFIENHSLYGRGIGWNDIQLLVAAVLSGNRLWTLDKRLLGAAVELGVDNQPG